MPSFFDNGKKNFWKTAYQVIIFSNICWFGWLCEVSRELEQRLGTFVCCFRGFRRLTLVNDVRKCMFLKNYSNIKKHFNLTALPACQACLKLRVKLSNYVTRIDKISKKHRIIRSHIWKQTREWIWTWLDTDIVSHLAQFSISRCFRNPLRCK